MCGNLHIHIILKQSNQHVWVQHYALAWACDAIIEGTLYVDVTCNLQRQSIRSATRFDLNVWAAEDWISSAVQAFVSGSVILTDANIKATCLLRSAADKLDRGLWLCHRQIWTDRAESLHTIRAPSPSLNTS
jgi:hypothetical protein